MVALHGSDCVSSLTNWKPLSRDVERFETTAPENPLCVVGSAEGCFCNANDRDLTSEGFKEVCAQAFASRAVQPDVPINDENRGGCVQFLDDGKQTRKLAAPELPRFVTSGSMQDADGFRNRFGSVPGSKRNTGSCGRVEFIGGVDRSNHRG